MFEHFSTTCLIFVLYFTVMTALIFLFHGKLPVIIASKHCSRLEDCSTPGHAMAEQGTKHPLEDAVLPILTRSKLEFEIGVRFVMKGLSKDKT